MRGADVNLENDEGISPLHQASYTGIAPIVEYLLDTGADYKAISKQGHSAYDFAIMKNNLSIIDVLQSYEKERR
jgi:ankyrin repeat protein